jgi:hypothetical protein
MESGMVWILYVYMSFTPIYAGTGRIISVYTSLDACRKVAQQIVEKRVVPTEYPWYERHNTRPESELQLRNIPRCVPRRLIVSD